MAIDTKNKKLSLLAFNQPWAPPLPDSSDGLDQADLQFLLGGYAGILWASVSEYIESIIASVILTLSLLTDVKLSESSSSGVVITELIEEDTAI